MPTIINNVEKTDKVSQVQDTCCHVPLYSSRISIYAIPRIFNLSAAVAVTNWLSSLHNCGVSVASRLVDPVHMQARLTTTE
jgi:hypothetical protein